MALAFCCTIPISIQPPVGLKKSLQDVKSLVKSLGIHSVSSSPVESLRNGNWVKLICGASFEDVVDIRNLSLVYTLAGVDCIDCAADESVVSAVNTGIDAARDIIPVRRPWVMISVNDDEDLHFRKAEFNPEECPPDCSRPCEIICPANAISLKEDKSVRELSSTDSSCLLKGGVITERCYGCGRCFSVCPYDKIRAVTYVRDAAATAKLLERNDVEAIEIHTNGRKTVEFKALWEGLSDYTRNLRMVAVSLPDIGDLTVPAMNDMYTIMKPRLSCFNLWQLDGRPMSGDIGRGATRESVAFAVRLTATCDRPHGFLQLAGGTNAHTVSGLIKQGLFKAQRKSEKSKTEEEAVESRGSVDALIGGIAFGGYARKIVGRILSSLQSNHGLVRLEDHPDYLVKALVEALSLVGTVKFYDFPG